MKTLTILSCMLALGAFTAAEARTISPDEALARLADGPRRLAPAMAQKARLVHTAMSETGQPAAYIFNQPKQGYMILAADDVAYPVLGYSESGSVAADSIPPQMQWWLEEYGRQIDYALAHPSSLPTSQRRPAADNSPIEPMIKTSWDQGDPYNQKCPLINGVRGWTGCVATSMAQVMNYWKYPAVGQGQITYTDESGCGKRLSQNFANAPFDWDNMLDKYIPGQYTQAQADAVATLMKCAGYSVRMSYAADSSGALAMNTASALVKYFKYDPNVFYTLRSYYAASQWERMIIDNLRDVGPILYGGNSMIGGGHSFIVDGYDGEGYFHFNWGWSEMSDGYYSLDALNPSALGAGGGGGGGYNFTQDAVFGIQPPTGDPAQIRPLRMTQMGSLKATPNALKNATRFTLSLIGEGECMWVNYNPTTLYVRFGGVIENVDDASADTIVVPFGDKPYELQAGYGVSDKMINPTLRMSQLELPDGKYKITMATLQTNDSLATWQPVAYNYGAQNSVVFEKTGNRCNVTNVPMAELQILDAKWERELVMGCVNRLSVTVTNPTEYELSRGFAPMLVYNDAAAFLGESILLTLKPGETTTRTWDTELSALSQEAAYISEDTEVVFTFFDEMTYNYRTDQFAQEVTLMANPGLPSLYLGGQIFLDGAREEGEYKGTTGTYPLWVLDDASNFGVNALVSLNDGYFSYTMMAVLLDEPEEGDNAAVLNYAGYPVLMTESGDECEFHTELGYSSAVPGKTYLLTIAFGFGSNIVPVADEYIAVRLADTSGVEDVSAECSKIHFDGHAVSAAGQRIELFNLQGVKVAEGWSTIGLNGLASGVYVARTVEGSMKISL